METAAAQDCVYGSLGGQTGSKCGLRPATACHVAKAPQQAPFEIGAFNVFGALLAREGLDRGSPDVTCRRILGSQSPEARGSGRTDSA
jgi:hypothetical protein